MSSAGTWGQQSFCGWSEALDRRDLREAAFCFPATWSTSHCVPENTGGGDTTLATFTFDTIARCAEACLALAASHPPGPDGRS